MSDAKEIQKTMQTVMQAHSIVQQFHQNVTELFRGVAAEMETFEDVFVPSLEEGALFTSSIESSLRASKSWMVKHLALPLYESDADEGPIFLVHVSTDTQFADIPEVWLGILSQLESHQDESFPWKDTTAYIFSDYFGPEDAWNEPKTWYSVDFEDELVSAHLSFCRLPLSSVVDRAAIRTEICERLHTQWDVLQEDEGLED